MKNICLLLLLVFVSSIAFSQQAVKIKLKNNVITSGNVKERVDGQYIIITDRFGNEIRYEWAEIASISGIGTIKVNDPSQGGSTAKFAPQEQPTSDSKLKEVSFILGGGAGLANLKYLDEKGIPLFSYRAGFNFGFELSKNTQLGASLHFQNTNWAYDNFDYFEYYSSYIGVGLSVRQLLTPNFMISVGIDNNMFIGHYLYYYTDQDYVDEYFSRAYYGSGYTDINLNIGAFYLAGQNRQFQIGWIFSPTISRSESNGIYYRLEDVGNIYTGLELRFDFLAY